MGFNRFIISLSVRLAFIMLGLSVVLFLMSVPGYPVATLITMTIIVALVFNLFRFVTKTNQELARFLGAVRHADFSQRFTFDNVGAGFGELGDTFTQILDRFREDRIEQESELRHLRALLEHVPVPLISLHGDETITLWNNASRRLFGTAKIAVHGDLKLFGQALHDQVSDIQPGEKRLVEVLFDGEKQRLNVTASEIIISSKHEKLIALQNIQSELYGMQMSAWQDLVRVLTHEIVNSITPVASLAYTAADLVEDASNNVADHPKVHAEVQAEVQATLKDAREAVMTVARRSDGLLSFIRRYRRFSDFSVPNFERFLINDLFSDIVKLINADWQDNGIQLTTQVNPVTLDFRADRQMIEQLLINLLQNSEHALRDAEIKNVKLRAFINQHGRVAIEVSDTGTGVAEDLADKIFVPFFTTRKSGSGVGLALSRQIMNAHGGAITYSNLPEGGVRFLLVF